MENYTAMNNFMVGKNLEGHGKIHIIDIMLITVNKYIYICIQKNGIQNFLSNTRITLAILKMMKAQDVEREISKEIALVAQILSPISCLFFFFFSCFLSRLQTNAFVKPKIGYLLIVLLASGSWQLLPTLPRLQFPSHLSSRSGA